MKTLQYKIYWQQQSLEDIHTHMGLSQQTRKISCIQQNWEYNENIIKYRGACNDRLRGSEQLRPFNLMRIMPP